MAQSPSSGPPVSALFEAPDDRLGPRLHGQVFGALPHATARALDVPEVAAAVRLLLARRWRPAQLAARVGALPAAPDPVPTVLAFLGQLLARDSPQQAWERDGEARQAERSRQRQETGREASAGTRAHWAGEVRRELGLRPRVLPAPAPRTAPCCASCAAPSSFFVTREVRLCDACVRALASGQSQLVPRARAG